MRSRLILAFCCGIGVLVPVSGAWPDDEKKPGQTEAKTTPADELKAIQQEYQKKRQEFFTALQAAKTQADRQKVIQEQQPKPEPFLKRATKLAEDHPGTPAAVNACIWALQIGQASEEGKKAEKLLIEQFIAKADMAEVATKFQTLRLFGTSELPAAVLKRVEANLEDKAAPRLLSWINSSSMYGPPSPAREKALNLLLEKFVNEDTVAQVCESLAAGAGNDPKDDERKIAVLRQVIGKSRNQKVLASSHYGLALLLKEMEPSGGKEAEEHLEKVVKEYGEVNKSLKTRAESELREIRLLGIGKPVPEIEGPDLQEKEFKLSDYRGKVVLLDFWGFW